MPSVAEAKEKLKQKLQLPKGIDKEVADDLDAARTDLSCDMIMVDNKVKADFRYSCKDDWRKVTKVFDNLDDFATYCKKFFAIDDKEKPEAK